METENTQKQNPDNLVLLFPNLPVTQTLEPKGKNGATGQDNTFLFSFLTDLVHCIKGSLLQMNAFSLLEAEKFDSLEFRKHLQSCVTENVKTIDSVLNTLLNFISISTPLIKTNMLNIVLEEILEANDKQIRDKKIRIFKSLEEDLPQTYMHPEQVRFVLNSLLQFALLSTPSDGSIGFSIRYFNPQNSEAPHASPARSNGAHIGISIGFSCEKKEVQSSGNGSSHPNLPKDETGELILKLVTEIVEKNRGTIKFIGDEKGQKMLITLKLSVERRKMVHYEPINI